MSEKKGNQQVEMLIALTKEPGYVPLWPWEESVIGQADYQRALDGLHRFIEEVEVEQLQTLEDLSAVASLIGHDLSVVTAFRGQKREHKTIYMLPGMSEPVSHLERAYMFTRDLPGQQLVLTAGQGHSLFALYRFCGYPEYRKAELSIRLPADRDIAIGQKPNVGDDSLYVIDVRGTSRDYHPAREPLVPHTQQGFAELLKDALRILTGCLAGLI